MDQEDDPGGGVESPAAWGRRQAAAAPPWTGRQLRAVAAALGVRLHPLGDAEPAAAGTGTHQTQQPGNGQEEGNDG